MVLLGDRASNLDLATVDKQLHTVDEGRIIRCQEEDYLGDFVRLADPTCRNEACKVILGALGAFTVTEQFVETSRIRHSRADGVDANVAILQIEYPVAGEITDGSLCCRMKAGVPEMLVVEDVRTIEAPSRNSGSAF